MAVEYLNGALSAYGPDTAGELERKINANFAQAYAVTPGAAALRPLANVRLTVSTADTELDTPRSAQRKINEMITALVSVQFPSSPPDALLAPLITLSARHPSAYAALSAQQGQLNRLFLSQWTLAYTTALANNLMAQLGDSRTDQGGIGYVGNEAAVLLGPGTRPYGYQTHLANYLRGRARIPSWLNFGVSGDTTGPASGTVGAISRVPAVIASGAGTCVVLVSVNDRGSQNLTSSVSIFYLEQIVSQLTTAGVQVVLVSELFKGSTTYPLLTMPEPQRSYHRDVRNWCLAQTGRFRVRVVDAAPVMCEDLTTLRFVDSMTGDGLHPDMSGTKALGYDVLGPQIADLFAAFPPLEFTAANLYNASTNPKGNLITNPLMTGTTGTANGNAGTWATGLTMATAPAGLTITGTAQATLNGKSDWQRVQISGTPTTTTSPSLAIAVSSAATNIQQGDRLSGFYEVYVASCTGPILSPCAGAARVTYSAGTPVPNASTVNGQATDVQGPMNFAPYSWYCVIDDFPVVGTVATTTFTLTVNVQSGSPIALDLYVRMPFLGKNQF